MTVESVSDTRQLAAFHTTASLYALDRRPVDRGQLGEPRLREVRVESYRESSVPETGHPGRLTDEQRSRIDFAHRDLDEARTADLGEMSGASLILLVERLRGRLDDALQVVEEISD